MDLCSFPARDKINYGPYLRRSGALTILSFCMAAVLKRNGGGTVSGTDFNPHGAAFLPLQCRDQTTCEMGLHKLRHKG